ncbi:hypothetical protein Syun_022760 [Stephania yunnanensis]|uniref:Protein MIZU-KUSSEI 1 n=1 Tax=Stephania yunnanensis TaxID=152371 RepID=A0AAP0FLN0_9MAGN
MNSSATIMPTKSTATSDSSSSSSSSSSFSRSSRHFQWRKKLNNINIFNSTKDNYKENLQVEEEEEDEDTKDLVNSFSSVSLADEYSNYSNYSRPTTGAPAAPAAAARKKVTVNVTVARRWRSVLTTLAARRARLIMSLSSSAVSGGLGSARVVVGTLFGHRRGHVHFAIQEDTKSAPAFLIELATPINGLVREMASGLVRIALECDKKAGGVVSVKLLQEPLWRTYCNGKKCGYGKKRESGEEELKVLKAVEPISMGAGVLPGNYGSGGAAEGELMYMRAKFERVVGSRDSEAFYMMNPDSNGGPELSVYLLRV